MDCSSLCTTFTGALYTDQSVIMNVTELPDVESTTEDDGTGYWDLVTNSFRMYFQIVNFVFICEIISLFGTGTNIMTIICFVKQGLKETANVSFLALTISDLMSLITLVWQNISVNPLLYETDIPFDPEQTVYLTAGIPHLTFSRITGWITALITLERCMCITHPLKVKIIFTRKRVFCVLCCIYVVVIVSNFVPAFIDFPFYVTNHPYLNRTWISLEFVPDRRYSEKYTFAFNSLIGPFIAFTIVLVTTVIIVVKLKSKTNWRKKSTAAGKSDSISNRDRSVAVMVVTISIIFIICYIPVCVIHIAMIIEPKLAIDGTFGNVFAIVFSFAYILESINASFNLFIYYKSSSRFKTVFRQTFCKEKDQGNRAIRDFTEKKPTKN